MSFEGKTRAWAARLFQGTRRRSIALIFVAVVLGVVLTWWTAQRADRQMRANLLRQVQLVAQAIDIERIQTLTGTEADFDAPEYLWLKARFNAVRMANPQCRFVYLVGRKADGTMFFFADSEPVGSEHESPAGRVYADASDELRELFDSSEPVVEGPLADEWRS